MDIPQRPGDEHSGTIEVTIRVDRLVELEEAAYQRSKPHHRLFRGDMIREAIAQYIDHGDHWGDAEPYDASKER